MKQIADLYLKRGEFTKALEYHEKVAATNPSSKEAWYTIGVLCWARSYHGGIMVSQEEREQVIQKGMDVLNKALALDPEYFDALSYMNLLYRERQKALTNVGNAAEAQAAYLKAEEYTKKALDVRKKMQDKQGA
jgi:tetratricopeptide (TPR) repeat protein